MCVCVVVCVFVCARGRLCECVCVLSMCVLVVWLVVRVVDRLCARLAMCVVVRLFG